MESSATEGLNEDKIFCERCETWLLNSVDSFLDHYLLHVRPCFVKISQLSDSLVQRLQTESYTINSRPTGPTVSPLKISLKKCGGQNSFEVVSKSKKALELEGNKTMLDRLGAGIVIKRKGKPENVMDANDLLKPDSPKDKSTPKENLLEKLGNIGGISIGKKGKSGNESDSSTSSGLSAASKTSSQNFDIHAYRKMKENETCEKTLESSKELLARLSGISGISFAPKGTTVKTETETEKQPEESENAEDDAETDDGSEREDDPDPISTPAELPGETSQSEVKSSSPPPDKANIEKVEQKFPVSTFPVKKEETVTSDFKVKPIAELLEKKEESEQKLPTTELDFKEHYPEEYGLNILQRMTGELSKTQPNQNSTATPNQVNETTTIEEDDDDDVIIMVEEIPNSKRCLPPPPLVMKMQAPSPTPSEQLPPDLVAPSTDNPSAMTGQVFQADSTATTPEQQAMLQEQAMSGYTDVSCLESYSSNQAPQMLQPDQQLVDSILLQGAYQGLQPIQPQNGVEYSTIATVDPSSGAVQPTMDSGFFLSGVVSQSGIDQPQQSPLLTTVSQVGGSEEMNQSFLQNFLTEAPCDTTVHHSMSAENPEFVSIDRLGQGLDTSQQQTTQDLQQQQQQGGFAAGMHKGPPQGPMEQLTQQVQSLPTSSPQINVIPQHQMQAVPQQMSQGMLKPNQHVPPLYPGYVFNQQYPQQHQTQQGFQMPQPGVVPPPPMLQTRPSIRPQIQPRPFTSIAAPRQRAPRAQTKRPVRFSHPQEMTPPKQRRMDLQSRMNSPISPGARGLTNNSPKRTPEKNMPDVLSNLKGITVTSNKPQSPQQRNPALMNLPAGISVTSSSSRNGGFAVPSARRSLVNNNIERPERCTTVDLTRDDEPLHRNKIILGRFACNQCPKVFTTLTALETHKASHRATGNLHYKCDRCSARYPTLLSLNKHKETFHNKGKVSPDLAVPIIDVSQPGIKEKLQRFGITSFIPLSQLKSTGNGVYGLPICNLESATEKVVSNLNALGSNNTLLLGKLKPLTAFNNRLSN